MYANTHNNDLQNKITLSSIPELTFLPPAIIITEDKQSVPIFQFGIR